VHVPLLVSVPDMPPAVRTELVEHVDVFPTICELVGAGCPAGVQGRSLVPLMGRGRAPCGWRDAAFSHMVGSAGEQIQMIRTRSEKLVTYDGVPGEMYDLEEDSKELNNRVANPEYAVLVQSLHRRLKKWEEANRRRA